MVAPEGRKQWPDVAIAHLTECDSNDDVLFLAEIDSINIQHCVTL